MRPRTTLLMLLIAFLALPAADVRAQADSASTLPVATSDTGHAGGGPRVESARVGLGRNVLAAPVPAANRTPVPVVQQTRSSQAGRTMMLVGGLVFMGGLLIGDDVGTAIAVTGLAVGAYGFYQLIR